MQYSSYILISCQSILNGDILQNSEDPQQGETSLTATIPNDIAEKLDLSKGQYMKIYVENEKIVLEKNK